MQIHGGIPIVSLLSVLAVVAMACGGTGASTTALDGPAEFHSDIMAAAACSLVTANRNDLSFVVLDVRTPSEFKAGHIEGALNIDVNSTTFSADIGKLDHKATYFVYCRSGNRSRTAVEIMRGLGFTRTYNLLGGYTDWVAVDCTAE